MLNDGFFAGGVCRHGAQYVCRWFVRVCVGHWCAGGVVHMFNYVGNVRRLLITEFEEALEMSGTCLEVCNRKMWGRTVKWRVVVTTGPRRVCRTSFSE